MHQRYPSASRTDRRAAPDPRWRSARTFIATALLFVLAAGSPSAAIPETLDRIASTQTIRVGYIADQAPFASKVENGSPTGYSIDLCKRVVEKVSQQIGGVKAAFVETLLNDAFDDVATGRIDMLCGAITITLDRRQLVDFSEPIFVTGASALLRTDSPRDLRELFLSERSVSPPRSPALRPFARSRIGVRSGTSTEVALRAAVAREGYDVEIRSFETHAEGVAALASYQIDSYFGDRALLLEWLATSGERSRFIVGARLLTREPYGIALKRGDADFRLIIDRVLTEFYVTSEFAELLGKYFPEDASQLQAQILGQSIPE